MKKLQYGIVLGILPLILAFAYYFSPSKPLSIVKDISQLPVDTYIDGQNAIVFKEHLYFFRETQQTGRELWQVDKDNNVSLALETIPGRESASVKAIFESENRLYVIAQVPNEYSSLIYYLESPQGDFVEMDLSIYINTDNLKEFNGKYFTLTSSGNNKDNTIVEFDGPDTKHYTINGNNWFYGIEDFTYFNNEIYYSWSDEPLREIRKIAGETEEIVYTSSHRIPFLFTTVDGVYFVENNYDTTPSSYNLSLLRENEIIPLKSFSSIDFGRSQVLNEKLILIAASIGNKINQLWEFSSTEEKQITNYQEEHFLRIEDLTEIKGNIYFVEDGFDGEKIRYSDGLNLYDVAISYDYLDQYEGQRIFVSNDKLIIGGRSYQDGVTHKGVSVINNGVATEVLEGSDILGLELFEVGNDIYSLISKNTSEVDLYRINTAENSAELKLTFNGEYASSVAADGVNNRIYLKYRYPDEVGMSPLSVIEGSSVKKLSITNTTGGSNPKSYTAVKDKTYFIAHHDEHGESIWESDGYDAQLVDTGLNENPDYFPELIFSVDERLIYFLGSVNSNDLQAWVLNEDGPKKLSQNSFNFLQSSVTNDGTQLYFVASFDGSNLKYFWRITPSRVELIGELEFISTDMELIKTPHGIFFTTGYDENTGVWKIDGSSLIEIDKSGMNFSASNLRKTLWDSTNVYIKECIDEYSSAIYRITEGNKLEAVDTGELSGKRCADILFSQLDGENIISLIDYGSEALEIWTLNEGKVVKVDSLGTPSYTKFVAKDSRLYFNARPSGSVQNNLFVYESGVVKNLNLGLVSELKIAKGSDEEGFDWLLYKEQYTNNGYQLYKYDGYSLSLHSSIPSNYRDIYKVTKVGDFNFMQIGNSGGDNELVTWGVNGELTYLNADQAISFSTNGSYTENLITNGHGKWLFLQGCNYIVGCEPYSINLNKFPTARIITDKSLYVAGYKVLVDGSDSTDPENNILEYNWKLVGFDNVQIEGNGTAQAAITLPLIAQDSDLTIELEIVDDGYDRSAVTQTISVEVNHAPEVVINAPSSAVEGSVVELSAENSSDAEGEALSFQWSVVTGENIALNNSNQPIASFTVPNIEEESDITIRVSVRDTVGNISNAEVNISLKVSGANNNPNPGSGNKSSGGGSTNWLLLLMLTSLMIIRLGYYRR